jgi:hypothetical protein
MALTLFLRTPTRQAIEESEAARPFGDVDDPVAPEIP